MVRSLLLAVLAASPAAAQTISTVWEASVPGVTTLAVSPDASTVAIGEAQFTNSVYIPSRTAIQLRDAATGAVTGGFVGGQNGAVGFPAPYFLGFDATGTSIFSGTEVVFCGGGSGNCSSSQSIIRLSLTGQDTFYASDLADFDGIATSGPYLTYDREAGGSNTEFAVFDTRQDTVALVFSEAAPIGTGSNTYSTVLDATFSPDGTRLATTRYTAGIAVDIRTVGTWTIDQTLGRIGSGQSVLEPAVSPDNSLVAIGSYPIASGLASGLYIFHTDGSPTVFTPWRADSGNEVRYGARLAFTSDNAYVVGVESGYVGSGTARWVSVFRVSDGVRVATRRIGTSTADPNGRGGALSIAPVPGPPGASRFAIAARDYAAVVEVRPGPGAVAAEGAPAEGGLSVSVAPNPAPNGTTVRLSVPEAQTVRVDLFDTLGRHVASLFDGEVTAGTERLVPVASEAYPAGVYIVRVTGTTGQTSRRVVLGGR